MIEKIEYKGYTIKIEQDDLGESSRYWDNLGHMWCFHRRYNLGDYKENPYKSSQFRSWKNFSKTLKEEHGAVVILPLYLYDHSGITMRTGPFSCPWDSGQVGFIFATRQGIYKEYSCKRITKKIREQVEKALQGEVETYDMYLTGDVWYYNIEDENGDDVDSLSGLYGYDYCIQEAKSIVDWDIADKIKKEKDRVEKIELGHRRLFMEMEAVGL